MSEGSYGCVHNINIRRGVMTDIATLNMVVIKGGESKRSENEIDSDIER